MPLRVHMVSLGCPKNRVDSEVMAGLLRRADVEVVPDPAEADAIVVNTCAFIRPATEESIETVLELARHKETGRCRTLVVAGCMPQRYGEELARAMPEVDHFLGTSDLHRVLEAVRGEAARTEIGRPERIYDHTVPRARSTAAHTAWLKISEGCDRRCAFCIIPRLRGRLRSRTVESLVAEAERLVAAGAVELNLVSQDSAAYGRDIGTDLGALLRALARVDGLEWVRVLYAYPRGFPESALRAIAEEEKVVPYLDLPLQHASDRVLAAMRRGVTRAGQERLLERVRAAVPGLAVRTTFITGFPGETDDDFEELLAFVEEQRFDRVGVFVFEPEEGTPAADMPGGVPRAVAEERRDRLMRLQARISREKHEALLGRRVRVLVDGRSEEGVPFGRMATQAPEVDGVVWLDELPEDTRAGRFVEVTVTAAAEYDLVARAGQAPPGEEGA